jgi:two-component system sensor histidine kinase GlrK
VRPTVSIPLPTTTNAPRPRRRWTLARALTLSHGALALALLTTLSLGAFALRRIDRDLRELRDDELGAIDEQEALHRAMWTVEVAMRHAEDACERGGSDPQIRPSLTRALDALREQDRHVGPHVGPDMRAMGLRYEALALRALEGPACDTLRSSVERARRSELDEQLTDLWISRSFELHREIGVREARARTTGRRSFAASVGLTVFVAVFGAGLARWLARSVARPLAMIAREATRIGRGDFAPIPTMEGPAEVTDLADELERTRKALAAVDALKQGFLASVSHELRTPLAKIREALSLLSDGAAGPVSSSQAELVAIASRACEGQIRLVTTLLDLSRLRAGALVQMQSGSAIDRVARDAVEAERDEADRRGVTLAVDAEETAILRDMDAALIERAIANLVRNAVGASPAGGLVRVRCLRAPSAPEAIASRAAPGSSWACVRVEDSGPGVPAAVRERLFDPFTTAPTEAHGHARVGIGLGLALVREVARAHGGDARSVEPEPEGRGGRFELWLPMPNVKAPA